MSTSLELPFLSRVSRWAAAFVLLCGLSAAVAPALVPTAAAQSAPAAKVGTVDFQRALNEVAEGAAARKRLEGMYAEKKAALDKMASNLEAAKADIDKQAMVLSDAAMRAKQEEFNNSYMAFQQAQARAEGEMQQAYGQAMESLIERMRLLAADIGKEKGYTVILEVNEGGVVYSLPSVDITDELIKRYNAKYPGTK